MCWLVGQRVILNQIQLKCDAPTDDIDYKVRFCENIRIKWLKLYSVRCQLFKNAT